VNDLNHFLSVSFSVSSVRSRAGGMFVAVITLPSEVLHDRCSVPRDTPRLLDKLASVFSLSSGQTVHASIKEAVVKTMFLKEPRDSLVLPVRTAFRPFDQDGATIGNRMFSNFFKGLPEFSKESPMSSDHLDGVRALLTVDVLPGATTRARGREPKGATLSNEKALSEVDAIVRREVFVLSDSNN
jgi:hypothetical protein